MPSSLTKNGAKSRFHSTTQELPGSGCRDHDRFISNQRARLSQNVLNHASICWSLNTLNIAGEISSPKPTQAAKSCQLYHSDFHRIYGIHSMQSMHLWLSPMLYGNLANDILPSDWQTKPEIPTNQTPINSNVIIQLAFLAWCQCTDIGEWISKSFGAFH